AASSVHLDGQRWCVARVGADGVRAAAEDAEIDERGGDPGNLDAGDVLAGRRPDLDGETEPVPVAPHDDRVERLARLDAAPPADADDDVAGGIDARRELIRVRGMQAGHARMRHDDDGIAGLD